MMLLIILFSVLEVYIDRHCRLRLYRGQLSIDTLRIMLESSRIKSRHSLIIAIPMFIMRQMQEWIMFLLQTLLKFMDLVIQVLIPRILALIYRLLLLFGTQTMWRLTCVIISIILCFICLFLNILKRPLHINMLLLYQPFLIIIPILLLI